MGEIFSHIRFRVSPSYRLYFGEVLLQAPEVYWCQVFPFWVHPIWAWVKTPLSEFIPERSYLLLPLQNDDQYSKTIRFTIPEG